MKKIILINALIAITSLFAQAEISYSMPAIEGGFKWNTIDIDGASSNKQSLAFQIGGSVVINIQERFGLRTGLFYSERPFKNEFGTSEVSGKITYAEAPLHLMFKLEDYAGIYFGPSISMKMGDEVSGSGSLTDVKGIVFPLTFGAQFKFLPNLGLNLFFETVSGELAKGLKSSRAIGANILFAFE